MKKRYVTFTVVFATLVLIGIQAIGIVDGNPVPWSSIPNQEKPTVTIETLQNYTTYNADKIFINFAGYRS